MQKQRFRNPLISNDSIYTHKQNPSKKLKLDDEKKKHSSECSEINKPNRSPKQTLALVFGYVGTAFHGMQKQLNSQGKECVRTVEGEIEKAILQCYGNDTNSPTNTKAKWSRVARTDKGVHAVAQVLAFRLPLPDVILSKKKMEKEERHQEEENSAKYLSNNTNIQENSYRNFIMQIQSFLDDAGYQEFIKVFKIYRVTKSFDARLQCSGRCYQYVLPLSAVRKVCYFAKTRKHAGFVHYGLINDEEAFKNLCTTDPVLDTTLPAVPFEPNECDKTDKEFFYNHDVLIYNQDKVYQEEIAENMKKTLSLILKDFIGTHNFHNFTPGGISTNPAMCRYVENIEVTWRWMDTIEPILIITLKGQSFLLNQIRKMIGLAVEITCGSAPKTAVSLSLNPSKRVNIHMVPGTGLLLHHASYDQYNKYRANPPTTPLLTFNDISEPLNQFCENSIYSTILKQLRENDCQLWKNWHKMVSTYPFFHTNYPLQDVEYVQTKKSKIT